MTFKNQNNVWQHCLTKCVCLCWSPLRWVLSKTEVVDKHSGNCSDAVRAAITVWSGCWDLTCCSSESNWIWVWVEPLALSTGPPVLTGNTAVLTAHQLLADTIIPPSYMCPLRSTRLLHTQWFEIRTEPFRSVGDWSSRRTLIKNTVTQQHNIPLH